MKRARLTAALIPLPLLLAALATHSERGGWVVYTFDDLPDHFVAGRTYEFSFTARAHGLTPLSGMRGDLVATTPHGGYQVAMLRAGEGQGRYRASLEIPSEGVWTVGIFFGTDPALSLPPTRAVASAAGATPMSERERGERLFAAKGCMTCHVSGMLPSGPFQRPAPGPVLTGRTFEEGYLRTVLTKGIERAPGSAPPGGAPPFAMPNLGLDESEVRALVAYVNADAPPR